MNDLRPISLCNFLYKIISKIITARLKPLMNSIIGHEHSAFTKGRLIFDNILLNHEIMHSFKYHTGKHNQGMAIKLDVSKAFDCVEWLYLNHMLSMFGFHSTMINWIMECVTSISYSVNINGYRTGYITPSRGLR